MELRCNSGFAAGVALGAWGVGLANRVVRPVAADRRAASRIPATIGLFSSGDGPEGSASSSRVSRGPGRKTGLITGRHMGVRPAFS